MCRDVSRIQATPHTGHRESGHPRQCLQPGREDLSLLSLQDAESQQLYEGYWAYSPPSRLTRGQDGAAHLTAQINIGWPNIQHNEYLILMIYQPAPPGPPVWGRAGGGRGHHPTHYIRWKFDYRLETRLHATWSNIISNSWKRKLSLAQVSNLNLLWSLLQVCGCIKLNIIIVPVSFSTITKENCSCAWRGLAYVGVGRTEGK